MKHKKIDTSLEKPVEIKDVGKKLLISEVVGVEQSCELDSGVKTNFSYMIFAFQGIEKKYGIDYEMIIVLNYLSALGTFSLRIDVGGKPLFLDDYTVFGLIKQNYNIKNKKLYVLSDKAKEIVSDFNSLINKKDSFVNKNTQFKPDVDSKVSNVLSNYFSS